MYHIIAFINPTVFNLLYLYFRDKIYILMYVFAQRGLKMQNKVFMGVMSLGVAVLLLIGAFTVAFSGQQPAEQNSIEGTENTEKILVEKPEGVSVTELGYEIVEDYGSTLLVEPNSGENQLQSAGAADQLDVLDDDLNKIHLKKKTIDVSSDTSLMAQTDEDGYKLVKTIGPIKPEWKDSLQDKGEIIEYIPDNTYLMDLETDVSGEDFVQWTGDYKPNYKISPDLEEAEDTTPLNVIIHEEPNELIPKLNQYGQILGFSEDRVEMTVDASVISEIAEIDGVGWIEEMTPMELLNAEAQWTVQTGNSGDRSIWNDHGLTGEGQVVGISDTGIDYDHAAFRDPEGDSIGSNHRKIVNYVAYANDNDNDESGHGTHTAGSIAGNDEPFGSNMNDGQAKNAKLSFFDIGDSSDSLDIPSNYADIFQPAYDDGARIHSNSWGASDSSYTSGAKQVDEFMWNNKDMLIFYANGNSGPSSNTIGAPATAKNIVSVGASGDGNQNPGMNDIADFSSRGPTDDGRIKPTIVAPGSGDAVTSRQGIESADSDGDLSTNNNGYISMPGTSMACPTAAGATTLVRQYFVDGYYPEGTISNPSAALIKSVMVNGAVEISGSGAYENSNSYPNNDQGWGRVNLENSLEFNGDNRNLKVYDETSGISTGTTESYTVTVEDTSEPLEVTMAYTDYPGSTSADKALVNDLNLKVTAPDGSEYKGNVFSGTNPGESTTGGDYDALNPLENVLRLNPQSGQYTIEVIGENIPNGPQPFALSVTGGLGGSGPVADFDYTPTTPVVGETVDFTDQASGDIDLWSWNFGDGSSSTSQNPSHSYSSAGTYTVELTVTDVEGQTDTTQQDITVSDGSPIADFTYDPSNPVEGDTVQFTDQSSDPDGTVEEWSWNFGDGSSSTSQNPTHVYDTADTYTVELTVTDNDGKTTTTTQDITVEPPSYCTVEGGDTSYGEYISNVQFNGINKDSGDDGGYADHTASVSDNLEPGQTYELSVTINTGGYSDYVSVAIDWNQDYELADNQVIEVGTGSSEPQTVTTSITVPSDAAEGQTRMRVMQEYDSYHTDPCSNQEYGETEDYTVSIGSTGPQADFDYSPVEPQVDETVQFTDQSTYSGGDIVEWSWTFGDGATSTQQNPTHSYSSDGTYSVELSITTDDGKTDTTTQDITVISYEPQADFDYSPTNPEVDQTVDFTDQSTYNGGDIVEWSWTFGDGATSSSQNPSHAYSAKDTYTVELTITTDDDKTATASTDIEVGRSYSQVEGGDTSYGEYLTNVQFNGINKDSGDDSGYADHTGSVSNDVEPGKTYELSVTMNTGGYPDYVTVVIDWDQDYDLSNDQVIEVGYGSSDPQTVTTSITVPSDAPEGQTRMRVMQNYDSYHTDPTSDQSYGETEDYTVSIGTGAPVADFDYNPTEPQPDETVQFTDQSTYSGGDIVGWSWSFGDGTTSSSQDPTHSYGSTDTYTVELTITTDDDKTATKTQDITVTGGEYCTVEGGDTSYGEYITNVQFNGINVDSGDNGGYGDGTEFVSDPVVPGNDYLLSVTMSTGGFEDYISVAIDWNQNYDLSDDTVYGLGSGSSDPQTLSAYLTVPDDAEPGQTRMRIMQEYNGYHEDPCSNQDYGETEDYTVEIGTSTSSDDVETNIENSQPDMDIEVNNNMLEQNTDLEIDLGISPVEGTTTIKANEANKAILE